MGQDVPILINLTRYILIDICSCISIKDYVWRAFTNYNLYNAPPEHTLEWVGLDNFKTLFTIGVWRKAFFSVITWTLVWTLVATTLQIALGLFLAIIVNHPVVKGQEIYPYCVNPTLGCTIICDNFNICSVI